MNPIRIFFQDNEILIDTVVMPIVAGSLVASMSADGATVDICRVQSSFVLLSPPWDVIADVNGNTFSDGATALAYVQGQFAMRRPVGETFGIATVAGADLAQGQPVAVSRATGQLLPARADTYALSFVAGLASADTTQGYAGQPAHGIVTLTDWTAIAGVASLALGIPYFLGLAGGLTAVPPSIPGQCVTRIGYAASSTTLIVAPTDPIQL